MPNPSHTPKERKKKRKTKKTAKRTPVSKTKARQILREGEIGGKKLTEKQKRLFGLIAGGGVPTRLVKKKRRKK